jgi:GTP cyclohydrolase IA
MEHEYANIIKSIGEDIRRERLRDTPKRADKAMEFLTKGDQQNLDDIVSGALFKSDSDEMIIVNISVIRQ